MILGLLISILSATYTIASSSSVTPSGDIPANSQATYSRTATTGRVGQMTAGNSTLLVLENWGGYNIDSIALEMRSNKTAGAGKLSMTIGKKEVWTIAEASFDSDSWNGQFSDEWSRISRWIGEKVAKDDAISIRITASENSLYINRYTIYYSRIAPKPYTVSYESGLGIKIPNSTEEYPMAGVVLPICPDTADWLFVGWSEEEILEADTCPRIWKGGDIYYPIDNCQMWAIYSNRVTQESISEYTSGEYALTNRFFARAMHGEIQDGIIATKPVEIIAIDSTFILQNKVTDPMTYYVDFTSDSTLTIQNLASETWIGYERKELRPTSKEWQYRILSDGSLCIYQPQGVLFWGYGADASQDDIVVYNAQMDWTLMHSDGILLFTIQDMYFTTWPFGKIDSVENIEIPEFIGENPEYILHIGTYELHIKNGKKWLQVR